MTLLTENKMKPVSLNPKSYKINLCETWRWRMSQFRL